MASSCSASLLAPSFHMKIVPYVPPAPKPKPKSKAKPIATARTAEYSRSGAGSSKDDGDWFHIDDFPKPDSSASRSLDRGVPALFGAVAAPGSLDHGITRSLIVTDTCVGVVGSLEPASLPEKPEHYRSSRELLADVGTDHATSVADIHLAMNELLDRSSRELPLIVESDAAEESHSAGKEGCPVEQYDDLDATVEDIEGIRYERLPAEDELSLIDVGVTDGPSATRKRTRPSSVGLIISSAATPDLTTEMGLEDPRSVKRRRLAEGQAESLVLDPVSTPKSTPPPTPGGQVSLFRAINGPSPGLPDSGRKDDGAGTPSPPQNDPLNEEDGDDGVYVRRTVEELLHSRRQSTSPFKGIEGEQDVNPNSDGREKNRKGSSGKVGKSLEDELNQVDVVSRRLSAKASQRRKRSDRPVRERGRSGRRGWSTMPMRALRNATLSQPRQPSSPKTDNGSATRSCSLQTSSPGTKAGGRTNKNHGPSADVAYQITDLTHWPVPKGSTIVAATVRFSESNLSLDPIALGHKLLGGEGKVIRMMQLSSDSWTLLGYRYDNSASGVHNRESPTLLNADWMSSLPSNAAGDGTNHLDDGRDKEYGNGEEGDMRSHQRTRVPWLKSDDLRLLAYKNNMDMEWKDIFELFPDRTPGAVRTRWHMLHGK